MSTVRSGSPGLARRGRKQTARSAHGMAITSHPLATRTALDVLRAGGNACDAALSAAAVQLIVEPHMTSITGALSLLYHEAATATDRYLNADVNTPLVPLVGFSARDTTMGRGVPVPGFWAGYEAALKQFGSWKTKQLLAPAIALAREGFELDAFLYGEMYHHAHDITRTGSAQAREVFFPAGTMLTPGELLRQERAARTLERLAEEGSAYFYHGDFARHFVRTVQDAGGVITLDDLAAYEVRWQTPVRGTYHGYSLVSSPSPDNGGVLLIQALNMVELLEVPRWGPPARSRETLAALIRIHNDVYAAGCSHVDGANLDYDTLLSKQHASERLAKLAMGTPSASPVGARPGTNHLVVADGHGNVASLLHSHMAYPWSNGLFVDGFTVSAGGIFFLRTMPPPGGRATIYIAPTFVYKGDQLRFALGSPSPSLVANILQNLVNMLDFGMSIEESVHQPRFGSYTFSDEGWTGGNLVEPELIDRHGAYLNERGIYTRIAEPWAWILGAFECIGFDEAGHQMVSCGDPRRLSRAEGL